jgi:hypothetical protein
MKFFNFFQLKRLMLEWWVPHNYKYNIIKKKLKIVCSTKKSLFLAILTQNSVTNKQVKAQSTEYNQSMQSKKKKRVKLHTYRDNKESS